MLSWDQIFKLMKLKSALEKGNFSVKNWYASKTIWTNIIAIITAVAAGATGEVTWQADLPVIMTAVLNLGLRFVTASAIGSPDTTK